MRLGLIQAKLAIVTALRHFKVSLHESMKPPFEYSPGAIQLTFKQDLLINFIRLE